MALGASEKDVLSLIVSQGFKIGLLGLGVGAIAALALTQFMSSLLFGVSSADPMTFLCVALLLGMVAFLASYIPARRAAKVDPMVALRYE